MFRPISFKNNKNTSLDTFYIELVQFWVVDKLKDKGGLWWTSQNGQKSDLGNWSRSLCDLAQFSPTKWTDREQAHFFWQSELNWSGSL